MVDSSSTSDSQTSRALNDKAAFYFEDDGSGSEDSSDCSRQIVVGICAMSKKSNSKPMLEILERLVRFEHLKPLIFEESVILNEPIERWPLCDCFISFHSKGFPLDKAVKYAELRKPMVINDLYMQYKIQDRQVVHEILTRQEIDHPRYVVLDREHDDCELVEAEDLIEVNKMVFHKPFVEKPLFAEDHNVYIYFPSSAGGGSQRLFRKIGSRSSVYSPVSSVRKTGSYVYEEFMPTDGTDVKVYTVGPDYAHAEARKSPALDGKVERDQNGKEVRYPVILSAAEKLIARKVCLAFKQMVCGFDLLRANGRSYVCDVNGFSFVKTSMKYYDDCAKILGNMVLRQLAPQLHIPYSITYQPEDIPIVPTTYGTMMELRNVIAVIRHGDRTPKQKMKMEVRHKKFFDLFDKYGGFKTCQLKLKRPKQLQEVLDIARFLLSEIRTQSDPEIEEKKSKLDQLKSVLEMYGHFSGINRKVQLKYQPQGAPKKSSSDDDEGPREASLVLILKWGGELTPAGKIQAEELGKAFRYMYPGGQGDYGHTPGLGILRLHSTFRHDLKIYASDEGRVQMTAAAFAKGFLALEGELTPILVQMVKSANMNGLLDNDNESSKYQNIVKEKLQGLMNFEGQLGEEECDKLATTGSSSLTEAIKFIGNPYSTCETIYKLMNDLLDKMNELKDDPKYRDMLLYHSESWELLIRRWNKLTRDFSLKNSQYDISKIPDIYDCVKYDLQHNKQVLKDNGLIELHKLSKAMADIVIPQEYGITKEEKMLISQCICTPLLRKILVDLQRNVDEGSTRLDSRYSKGITTPHRHVRTRLYFTSESHIHSLLTIIRYGGLLSAEDEQWTRAMEFVNAVSELNYMTQIVIMMYEDPTKDPLSDERFHVELHFSPGAYTLGIGSDPAGQGYRTQIKDKNARRVPTSGSGCVGGSSSTTSVGGSAAGAHTTGSLTAGAFTAGQKCSPGGEARHKAFQHLSEARLMESVDEQVEQSDSETSASPVKEIPKKATNTADVAATVVAGEKAAGKTTKPAATDSVSRAASKKRGGSSSAENVAASGSESTDDASKATEGTVTPRLRHHSGDNILHNVHKQDEYIRVEKPHRNSFSGFFIPNVPESPDNFTMGGGKRMLISTKVISGSSSAPNLLDLDFLPSSQAGLEGWKVPSIRPLETLHNSLTLKQLENFLIHMTEGSFRTPVPTPPYPPSTPCSSMVSSTNAQIMAALSSTQAYSMSSSMCSSEMSPSGLSHPDDILQRLKQLIDNGNVKQPSTNGSDELSSSTTGTPLELAAVTSASAISTAATSSTVAEATTDVAEATTDVAEATTDVAEATTDVAAHGVEPATDEETSVETKDGQTSKMNEVCVDSTKSSDHHQSSVSDSSVTHSATSTLSTKASLADTTAPASAGAEDTNVSNGTSDAASDTG